MWIMWFIRRFPARDNRWRFCSPEEASSGAVPVQDANRFAVGEPGDVADVGQDPGGELFGREPAADLPSQVTRTHRGKDRLGLPDSDVLLRPPRCQLRQQTLQPIGGLDLCSGSCSWGVVGSIA